MIYFLKLKIGCFKKQFSENNPRKTLFGNVFDNMVYVNRKKRLKQEPNSDSVEVVFSWINY